jgi:hypothetical protein
MPGRSDVACKNSLDTILSSGARTTSGNSGVIEGFGFAKDLRLQLNVSAVGGTTPNLTVTVEDTLDGVTFNTIGSFAAKTAVAREVINVTAPFASRLRISWVITGTTPSFTFDVIANARG